jgi:hypothetical protein
MPDIFLPVALLLGIFWFVAFFLFHVSSPFIHGLAVTAIVLLLAHFLRPHQD